MSKVIVSFDAMGGDHAPEEIVKGAVMAARNLDIKSILVGKSELINSLLAKENTNALEIEVVDAPDEIDMGEKNPARAVRAAKNASVVVANRLVAEGKAHAVVAAGNTGAATATSLFELKRVSGFERPCIVCFIPTATGKMILIDAGSNIETSATQMLQSAILGDIFVKVFFGIEKPRVGLLNVGEEPGKGTELYKESHDLLSTASAEGKFNFIGNVEGKTIINDICDVALCDGFVGNIHLKSLEGGLKLFAEVMKSKGKKSLLGTIGLMALKAAGVFDGIRDHVHPSTFGGAVLGGVNHISIIAHGGSDARAIMNAARLAKKAHEADLMTKIKTSIGD